MYSQQPLVTVISWGIFTGLHLSFFLHIELLVCMYSLTPPLSVLLAIIKQHPNSCLRLTLNSLFMKTYMKFHGLSQASEMLDNL